MLSKLSSWLTLRPLWLIRICRYKKTLNYFELPVVLQPWFVKICRIFLQILILDHCSFRFLTGFHWWPAARPAVICVTDFTTYLTHGSLMTIIELNWALYPSYNCTERGQLSWFRLYLITCFFYKHNVYKHTEAQIPKTLSIF